MKKIPVPLLVAIVVGFGFELAHIIALKEDDFGGAAWLIAEVGIGIALDVLVMAGALELAGRLTGRAAVGARIAAVVSGVSVLVELGWIAITYHDMTNEAFGADSVWKTLQLVSCAVDLAIVAGLGIATRRLAPALVGCVSSLFATPPWFLRDWMYDGLHLGFRAAMIVQLGPQLVRYGAMLWLAWLASRDTMVQPAPERASLGLRLAARALWLRLIVAAVLFLFVMLLAASASGGGARDLFELYRFAMLAALAVNAIALAMFVRGVLIAARSHAADLSPWRLVAAAAASLWVMGVLLARLPWMYRQLYGGSGEFGMGDNYTQFAVALDVTAQLVATGGITALLSAIARLAGRRGLEQLRENAAVRTGAFVVLLGGSIAVQHWIVERSPGSTGLTLTILLLATAAGIYATVIAAKLCMAGAAVVEAEASLPPAKVVQ